MKNLLSYFEKLVSSPLYFAGKLGHGDTARLYRPQTVAALQGQSIAKVQAGQTVSMALTVDGKVCASPPPPFSVSFFARYRRSFSQIWSWGGGACLGQGSMESSALLLPRVIEDLANVSSVTFHERPIQIVIRSLIPQVKIVDMSLGDNHCLALSQDCAVFAWGINSSGQCGLGHALSPVFSPQPVKALAGVPVHQVREGFSSFCKGAPQ